MKPPLAQSLPVESLPVESPPAVVLTHKKLRRKELLSLPADTLWTLDSGFVRIVTWDEEGNVTTLGIWGPGEHLEAPRFCIHPHQIECLTPAHVRQVTATPEALNCRLRHKAQLTEELLYLLQIRCTRSRLQQVLAWLAQRFGQRTAAGHVLPLRLTHQELADLIGSTRVTVTRILSQLQSQGEIQLLCRQMVIPNCSLTVSLAPSPLSPSPLPPSPLSPSFDRSSPLTHAQSC